MESVENTIEKFAKRYREFAKIDPMNLTDRALQVPAEKNFWVEKLMAAKRSQISLEKKRAVLMKEAGVNMVKKSPIANVTKQTLEQVTDDVIDKIDELIVDNKMLVDYLAHVVNNITYIAQDFKNIVESLKLEQE